jgi:hypothetical protein
MDLKRLELLFERQQVPKVVYNRHLRVESNGAFGAESILRDQQVAAWQLMQADLGSTSPKARLLAIARSARRKITSPVNSSGDSFSLDEPCPRFTPAFRLLWVWLSTVWSGWKSTANLMKPRTVLKWHEDAFLQWWRYSKVYWWWACIHREFMFIVPASSK